MKVYLDVSCLNRPFDDQSQDRIRLESEAVTLVLRNIDQNRFYAVATRIAEIEVAANPDSRRRLRVQALLPSHKDVIELTVDVFRRGEELESLGIKSADALHVASAEAANATVMLTCDDRLLRSARRHGKKLRVRVANPVEWLAEFENASLPE